MPKTDLDHEWQAAFGIPMPEGMVTGVAERCLVYHRQERREGGLSTSARRVLADLASQSDAPRRAARAAPCPRYKPGTRLLRTWRGRTYVVTIADTGYQYNHCHYRSLSVIAREITGTAWSGPAFFGLKSHKKVVST
jgi:hypothetical protein